MNDTEFDRDINQWLRAGPSSASPRVLQAVVEHVRTHHPDGGLRARWDSFMESVVIHRPAPLVIRPIVLLALLALSFAFGAFVYASWQQNRVVMPIPTPTPSAAPTSPSPTQAAPLYQCPPETDPNRPGPRDQIRPVLDPAGPVAVDTESGVVVTPSGTTLWLFDLCSNTWRKSAVPLNEEARLAAVYDADSDLTVLFGNEVVLAYDADADMLREWPAASITGWMRAAYDPISGLIFVLRFDGDTPVAMSTYDVDRDVWQGVAQQGDLPPSPGALLMAYDSSARRIVLYHGTGLGSPADTYEFDPATSTWTQPAVSTPSMDFVWGDLVMGGEIAYDQAHARTMIFSRGRAIAYDASADAWGIAFDSQMEADSPVSPDDPTHRQATALAFDPVNERVVVLGGSRRNAGGWFEGDDVIAFDLDTRSWTELLPLSRPGPIAGCPEGADPDQPGPVGQERPQDVGPSSAFDSRSGRVVAVSGGSISGQAVTIWTFDVCANTWSRSAAAMIAAPGRSPVPPLAIVYDEARDLAVMFADNVITYQPESDALVLKSALPRELRDHRFHVVYQDSWPRFVVRDDDASLLWTYDLSSDAWEPLTQGGDMPPTGWTGASLLAYDPIVDDLILYLKRGELTEGYQYDFNTAAWSRQDADPPPVELTWGDLGYGEIAYDSAHARTVVFSLGRVVTYDAEAGQWQVVFDERVHRPGAASRQGVSLVYDSINSRILALGGTRVAYPAGVAADDVVAFDLETNSWATLLEPSTP